MPPASTPILKAQKWLVPLTLLIHLWVVIHGYQADGLLWALAYLVLFVYAEGYWLWRSLQAGGPWPLLAACALSCGWWLYLFTVYARQQRKSGNAAKPDHSAPG